MSHRKIIVVLGMHRSGTSAIAKGIVELGAFPGNHLMEAREDNPKGFWEDKRIVALNDEMLEFFDLKWDSIDNPALNRFRTVLPLYEKEFLPRAMELAEDLFRVSDVVMIKDPRMCVLLPFWQKVFAKIGAEEKYIWALRDPLESAKSLEKRNQMDIQYALQLWLYYNAMVFQNIGSEFLVCSISSLMERPMEELKRIGEFIGADADEKSLQKYCDDFLDASLLHHKAKVLETGDLYGDLRIFRAMLEVLTDWSESGKRSPEEANAWYLDHSQEIFKYLKWGVSLNDFLHEQKAHHNYLLQVITDEVDKLLERNNKLTWQLQETQQKVEQLERDLSAKEKEIDRLSRLGTSLEQELKERQNELQVIYQSEGWKLLLILYKIRDRLLPQGTKRRLFVSLAVYFLFRPRHLFRSLSIHNIKLLFNKLKTDSPDVIMHKVKQKTDLYAGNDGAAARIGLVSSGEWMNRQISVPVFDEIDVSIIIPAHNQFHYNMNCIYSIVKNTRHVRYEIILIDDVSMDETAEIENIVENLRVLRNRENQGFLINCNNGAKLAKGKYILFLNNDTQVQENWLEPLVRLIESDDRIGMVGSKLVYPDGRLQEAGGIIWKDAGGWNYGRLDDPDKPDYNYVKEVDYISGACIMIRADLWKEIGGFDTRFVPAYYEDTDLAFEVRRRGYKVMYQPQSVVVHFEGVSHGTNVGTGIKSYQEKNKEKFLEKWAEVLASGHFANADHVFWARDRSKERRTILFIDHYVPQYDQDAGSRFVFHYLKLFVEMGFHVIFIGDNFAKPEPYTTALEQLGIQVLYGHWYAGNIKSWLQDNGQYIDYVYLNRPHISVKYIDLVKKLTKAKIVYVGHDLHYLRELRNYQVTGDKELLKSSNYWKKIEFGLFEKADVIHTVSSYEKEVIAKEFPGKIVRHIPLYIYDRNGSEAKTFGFGDRQGLLFVGGFNHKPNVDAVLWFVQHVFPKIAEQEPNITFTIVGSNPPEEIRQLQSERIKVTGYVTDEELVQCYNRSRVVVVPLRFGAGVKGKVVEALYHQVPIVTTSIGAEGLVDIEQYVRIADQEQDFVEAVLELYCDVKKWSELAFKSGDYVLRFYSSEAAKELISKDMMPGDTALFANPLMTQVK